MEKHTDIRTNGGNAISVGNKNDNYYHATNTTSMTTHCDSGQQSLGHIGNNNANKEDDGIEPWVAEDESDDEERDAKHHCHSGDDVNEVSYLASYWRLSDVQAACQVSNPTHHRAITSVDYQTSSRA